MVTIYYNDDQYFSLDELQIAIPDSWQMPSLGEYISEDGSVLESPPLNSPIVIKKLSELLLERVEGFQ